MTVTDVDRIAQPSNHAGLIDGKPGDLAKGGGIEDQDDIVYLGQRWVEIGNERRKRYEEVIRLRVEGHPFYGGIER